ncbi:MAG: hypothetical protein JO235_10985 [Chroococcidiopsidaceae cyanobacterium CP_BM_RX_35]|nr:hypothetical protein [Chroococcidiopsidaceae cyanobacterium CP_BM_RX_35]
MQTTTEHLQIRELELDGLLIKIASLPLFQYAASADHFFKDGRCKLRTLEELQDLKAQYQQIYFNSSTTAEGKRVIFHHLRKLSSRIARIRFDGRKYC